MGPLTMESAARLNNGVEMPMLGLGTYKMEPGLETRKAVRWALAAGYRHFDTAKLYNNERDVGAAIRESDVPREELFVTTKLWNTDHGRDRAIGAFERSLGRLGMDYVDLYLVHWPVEGPRLETWGALEEVHRSGRARAIGVSNYQVNHLEELLEVAEVVPAVNQVEFSPFLYQAHLHGFCEFRGIRLEAYSPLTKGTRLDDPSLAAVAAECGRTPAQVLVRWCLQKDVVVIPKSSRKNRILENADVFGFELTEEQMEALDALDEGHRTAWDPTDVP